MVYTFRRMAHSIDLPFNWDEMFGMFALIVGSFTYSAASVGEVWEIKPLKSSSAVAAGSFPVSL